MGKPALRLIKSGERYEPHYQAPPTTSGWRPQVVDSFLPHEEVPYAFLDGMVLEVGQNNRRHYSFPDFHQPWITVSIGYDVPSEDDHGYDELLRQLQACVVFWMKPPNSEGGEPELIRFSVKRYYAAAYGWGRRTIVVKLQKLDQEVPCPLNLQNNHIAIVSTVSEVGPRKIAGPFDYNESSRW